MHKCIHAYIHNNESRTCNRNKNSPSYSHNKICLGNYYGNILYWLSESCVHWAELKDENDSYDNIISCFTENISENHFVNCPELQQKAVLGHSSSVEGPWQCSESAFIAKQKIFSNYNNHVNFSEYCSASE